MMARRTFGRGMLGLMVSGMAFILAGCGSGSDQTLRYKIAIEVDTPSGVKTSFSVLETDMANNGFTYGQAPYVDLGEGRYVFALLDNQFGTKPMYGVALDALKYPELQPRLDPEKHLFIQAKKSKPIGVLRREDYPMLVTFDDINDPKTVREFNPGGVRRIIFQVVDQDEPLTIGLEEKFAWAIDGDVHFNGDKFVRGTADEVPFAQQMNASKFRWRKK